MNCYSVINAYEPTAEPTQFDWWWMLPRSMTITAHFWSNSVSHGMLGFPQSYPRYHCVCFVGLCCMDSLGAFVVSAEKRVAATVLHHDLFRFRDLLDY